MSRIAVFLAEGFEEIEALTPVDLCRRAGIQVITVSVGETREVAGSHHITVLADRLFSETDFDGLDMLVLPGGKAGTQNLEAHQGLMSLVDDFYRQGKYVAAICAAPSILGHRGILEGRKACCYPGWEEHLKGAQVSRDTVCVSDHVITSRGMGCAVDFSLALVETLCGAEEARRQAAAVVYR